MSTWVLLRGLAREARHWGEFPQALAAQIGAQKLVCLDLPGSGIRNNERSPSDVQAIVASCRDALRAQDAAPPYLLLAMSLGAMVAVAWSTRHPQEIEGAVLVNTSLRGFGAWYRRLRVRQYPRLLQVLTTRDEAAERAVLAMTSRHPSVGSETLIAHWTAIRRERPVARSNALRQLWAAARYSAPAAKPGVPLLVLASRRDDLVDHACSLRLATAWDAPLVIHPTAGHDLPLDAPEWVIGEILRWREQAARSGAPGDRWRSAAR
jgi:pimeloyl-ACP methyl ester carboxylesterase